MTEARTVVAWPGSAAAEPPTRQRRPRFRSPGDSLSGSGAFPAAPWNRRDAAASRAVRPAALCMVPGKSSGSQDVPARSALWPCASSQSSASRRVIPARKREARFGNTPGSGSARNRVLVAIIPGRGPQAGESRDSGARPSGRPGAGAPPASPGGPRPRTARTLRELPGEPGAPPCDCGSTCRERRASCAGTSEKAADDPANGRARATRGCPTSRKIKRIERGTVLPRSLPFFPRQAVLAMLPRKRGGLRYEQNPLRRVAAWSSCSLQPA